jgi:hypothetical protein
VAQAVVRVHQANAEAPLDNFRLFDKILNQRCQTFSHKAAQHGMSQLRKNARAVKSTKDVVAIVGGTLVDGTGKPPINDAVVVIQAGRIISVGLRSQVIIPIAR